MILSDWFEYGNRFCSYDRSFCFNLWFDESVRCMYMKQGIIVRSVFFVQFDVTVALIPIEGHRGSQRYFSVDGRGLKTGDVFRFYYYGRTTALSSISAVSSHLRSFNQGSKSTTGGDKPQVFGGLIFSCAENFDNPNVTSSPFLDNFPGVPLCGNFCGKMIGRRVITKYVKESEEQKALRCSVHIECSVYFIMSYSPSS